MKVIIDHLVLQVYSFLFCKHSLHVYFYVGQEQSKISSASYKTFQLIPDSDFYRPKLLADSIGNETEPIDQITALYMRGTFVSTS